MVKKVNGSRKEQRSHAGAMVALPGLASWQKKFR
jgi:hypothetical protein